MYHLTVVVTHWLLKLPTETKLWIFILQISVKISETRKKNSLIVVIFSENVRNKKKNYTLTAVIF